ncbi:MAG: LacI family transcriptional regulator [Anaerotruncus sp.]|nr:LacI family transcriptional regulator [Anaerotruncus sp.]
MTIMDIAAEAGVSIATVSRVLNQPEKVKPKTRERVQAILKKHHYRPNAIAQGLVRNTLHTVGILSVDIRREHFSTSAYTLESLFFDWGYTTILCNTGNDLRKKIEYLRILAERKVDGLVLLGSIFCHPDIEQAIARYMPHTPIILTNGQMPLPNIYSILGDNARGMEQLVEHIVHKGCKKPLLIHQDLSLNAQRKLAGFRLGMQLCNLPVEEHTIWSCGREDETGISVIDPILQTVSDFDALICADDLMAIGIIRYLKDRGISVPKDIRVTGYGNSRQGSLSIPSLTTIDSKEVEMAETAANMLHQMIEKKESLQEHFPVFVKPELIIRESA